MDSKPERLTQLSMSSLAALCQKVAEESSADGVTVDKALRLKRRWVELVSRETPPEPNLKTHEGDAGGTGRLEERNDRTTRNHLLAFSKDPHLLPLLKSATEGETTLTNFSGIVGQLKKERDRVQQQLSGLNAALAAFAGVYTHAKPKRRKMSAQGRARIAAAQRARWAKKQKVVPTKRTMSASARRKIAAAQRARWAKVKAKQEKKAA